MFWFVLSYYKYQPVKFPLIINMIHDVNHLKLCRWMFSGQQLSMAMLSYTFVQMIEFSEISIWSILKTCFNYNVIYMDLKHNIKLYFICWPSSETHGWSHYTTQQCSIVWSPVGLRWCFLACCKKSQKML